MDRYDALVIGGGPAGATAALALARGGLSVALVEQARFPRGKVCGEYVSPATLDLLLELGVGDEVMAGAGPQVRRVAVYAGQRAAHGDMPAGRGVHRYGRAIRREHLDTVLFAAAARAGAVPWQPARAIAVSAERGGHACTVTTPREGGTLHARCVIAAHGSLEGGALATAVPRAAPRGDDLFGFTTHVSNAKFAADLLPLVSFAGGYAGLVHGSATVATLSCCVKRDALRAIRARYGGRSAGAALLDCIRAGNAAAREALEEATCETRWLGCGPLRPGARATHAGGIHAIGNAAGEPHPIVGEGMSIAIESAVALSSAILRHGIGDASRVAADYRAAWQTLFHRRIRLSALYGRLALDPRAAHLLAYLFCRMPSLITLGARWSGKGDTRGLRRLVRAAGCD